MPPIENELAECDFDNAVSTLLYVFENKREAARVKSLASGVGYEVARILAPLFGGEVGGGDDSPPSAGCDHEFNQHGQCIFCGLVRRDGVTGYDLDKPEAEGHEIGDTGLKTAGSPRVIMCEHDYAPLNDNWMKCLHCGHMKQKRHFEG